MFNLTETPAAGAAVPVFSPGDGITSANFALMMQPVANRLKYLENAALGSSTRLHAPVAAATPQTGGSFWAQESGTVGWLGVGAGWVQVGNSQPFIDFDFAVKAGWRVISARAVLHGGVRGVDSTLPDLQMPSITPRMINVSTGAITSGGSTVSAVGFGTYNSRHELERTGLTLTPTENDRVQVRITGGEWTSAPSPIAFAILGVSIVVNTNP